MLKSVSSITNAIGALNFQGTWNASTNTPTLTSSVGTKGDYYVVGTAGSTNLNGISNWGVGDLATFNGSVWQRVEGGADLNGLNLSVSGTSTLSGLTASTALALNASKEIVSVTNTGTGSNVLATTPTLVGDATLSTGNLIVSGANKGMAFPNNTITEDKVASFKKSASTTVASGSGRSDQYFLVDPSKTFTITATGLGGLVTIVNGSAGEACTFFWSWNTATITILGNGGTTFVASAAPILGQLGISKSATSSVLTFKTGPSFSAGNISVCLINDYASATTDPV